MTSRVTSYVKKLANNYCFRCDLQTNWPANATSSAWSPTSSTLRSPNSPASKVKVKVKVARCQLPIFNSSLAAAASWTNYWSLSNAKNDKHYCSLLLLRQLYYFNSSGPTTFVKDGPKVISTAALFRNLLNVVDVLFSWMFVITRCFCWLLEAVDFYEPLNV